MKLVVLIIFLLIIFYIVITYSMFLLVSKKKESNNLPMSKNIEKILKPYKSILDYGNNWIKENNKIIKDIYINSNDNLKLHGILIERKNSKGIFIESHGYRSTAKRDLYASAHEYYNLGYSVLLIDNRTSNKSEGTYITFGMRESEDIIEWIKYINKNYPYSKIILAGISMGASSVLMSLKDVTKSMNVKCALVDSSYISAYDEIVYCISHYFHLPGKIFINMINYWCKSIAKFDLKEKNTVDCLVNSKIPILFIHGLDDDFVPYDNSKINYEKYNGPKEFISFEKASHGMSYLVDSKKYVNAIKDFIDNY